MDWKVGIPSFLTVVEMLIWSFLFLWAYNWRPYAKDSRTPRWNPLHAIIHVWNLVDIFGGILDVFKLRARRQRVDDVALDYRYAPAQPKPSEYGYQTA